MAAVWLQVADVRSRALGSDSEYSDEDIEVLLEDAEDLALQSFPDLAERVSAGKPSVARVRRVLANVVVRKLRNPEGIRTIQDSTGPFSGSTTFAGDNPGEMYLTDEDKRALSPPGAQGRRAFSVRPRYGLG
ncbi:hypothetical protein GCM10027061_21600 [Nesterenkonia suensis]